MEIATGLHDYDVATAQSAARKLMRPYRGRLDPLGHDVDDYRAILLSRAVAARRALAAKNSPVRDERSFICACVWNEARTLANARAKAERRQQYACVDDVDAIVDSATTGKHEARMSLLALQQGLCASEWSLIARVSDHDGVLRAAHEPERDGTYSSFKHKVGLVRAKAQRIMGKSMATMTHSKDLLERAEKLAVPFVNSMSDEEIQGLVEAKEKSMAGVSGDKDEVPSCHGLYWEAVAGLPPPADGSAGCVGCDKQSSCLEVFAKTTVPDMIATLGAKASSAALAQAIGVAEEAIKIAMARHGAAAAVPEKKHLAVVPPLKVPEVSLPPPPVEAVAPVVVLPPPVVAEEPAFVIPPPPAFTERSPVVVVPDLPKSEPEQLTLPGLAPTVATPTPAVEETPVPKEAKKKAAKKTKTPTEGAAPKAKAATVNPTKAGPASPAPVPAKVPKVKPASHVAAPAAPKTKKQPPKAAKAPKGEKAAWGTKTADQRFERERSKKSKAGELLRSLKPGDPLPPVVYREKMYLCRRSKTANGYECDQLGSQLFATAQSMVAAITGTQARPKQLVDGHRPKGVRQLCNWNVAKLFRVGRPPKGVRKPRTTKPKPAPAKPARKKK